ncbi:sugar-binding transcriptional regulator [Oceaniovalibus sp. ACAM 378]|uniref:sugar-binding transcriptional regulator n=1 Tax=Oceaniovalibus sp. ACAM 378 TaxID=2599923 RepID=UPI0011DA1242|nr:sugar-binding domain-containing protein [Oceaniovalibus sp. ACAM 378]TYB87731.1 transcriptional regulator [Oceaniovalibus sp. ACAM 378]
MDERAAPKNERVDAQIVEATWLYYRDGLNQNAIAQRLGISRASVVNYLQEARKRDWVRISIDSDVFLNHTLSGALCDRFGLAAALVIPSDPAAPGTGLERVARATADWLPTLLEPGDRLGVAWGETVYRVAEAMPRHRIADLTVVQLVGSRPAAMGFAAETCSSTIARRLGAHCINLHVPLLLSTPELAEILKNEPIVAEQLAALDTCNKTIFAAGTCTDTSHIALTGIVDPATLAGYVARGAQAVVCGRFIDGNGLPVEGEMEPRMISVRLTQMRGKDMGLLVGSGAERVEPMRAALRGGYATHLATCTETAAALLA